MMTAYSTVAIKPISSEAGLEETGNHSSYERGDGLRARVTGGEDDSPGATIGSMSSLVHRYRKQCNGESVLIALVQKWRRF
jgi:hypothetical protein